MLRRGVEAFFAFLDDDREAWRVLFDETLPAGGEVARRVAEYRERLLAIIVEAQLQHLPPERRDGAAVQVEALAHALFGACETLARWWLHTGAISDRPPPPTCSSTRRARACASAGPPAHRPRQHPERKHDDHCPAEHGPRPARARPDRRLRGLRPPRRARARRAHALPSDPRRLSRGRAPPAARSRSFAAAATPFACAPSAPACSTSRRPRSSRCSRRPSATSATRSCARPHSAPTPPARRRRSCWPRPPSSA